FNTASNQGAGIYVGKGSKPSLNDNLITNNFTGTGGSGGGLYTSGIISMDGNRVAENGAPGGSGGGVYLNASSSLLTNNTVTQNFANFGGGILTKGGAPVIQDNVIDHNTVLDAPGNGEGAGLHISGKSTPLVTGNDFDSNTAHNGGGIYA